MKKNFIRSTLFNLVFYAITALCSIAFLPLLIFPRKLYLNAVRLWLRIIVLFERIILGISYEIRGREHLPQDSPLLIAAKHQSAYETLKLHLVFKDPAIVLKKELLAIPIWGWHLKKSGVIAIDRSSPERALKSIESGALTMKEQGRQIVIFPQGTRVYPNQTPAEKPYKAGIFRVQKATNLPIIPLALNSGLFWPRNAWFKSSGKIVFQFLKPIQPGKSKKNLMRELEQKLEEHSTALMNEMRLAEQQKKSSFIGKIFLIFVVMALAFGAYSHIWFETAETVKQAYQDFLQDDSGYERLHSAPVISGFPGKITLNVNEDNVLSPEGSIKVKKINAHGWPFPGAPIKLTTGMITIHSYKWPNPVICDSLSGHITFSGNTLHISKAALKKDDFQGSINGSVNLDQEPVPELNITVSLTNHSSFLNYLAEEKIIKERVALFTGAGFNALADEDGIVRVPLTQRDRTLYAGPFPVLTLPTMHPSDLPRREKGNQPAPAQ